MRLSSERIDNACFRLGCTRRRWIIVIMAICAVVCGSLSVYVWLICRRARIEHAIIDDLVVHGPTGGADDGDLPALRDYIYDFLRIPKPITGLSLSGPSITDEKIAKLRGLANLRGLGCDQCAITDEGIDIISYIPTIEWLELLGCDNITDNAIIHMARMKGLQRLAICGVNGKISGRTLSRLACLQNLTNLHIDCYAVSDDAVEPIGSLKHLTSLDIRGTSITDAGIRRLSLLLPETLIRSDSDSPTPIPKDWGKWNR